MSSAYEGDMQDEIFRLRKELRQADEKLVISPALKRYLVNRGMNDGRYLFPRWSFWRR